MSRPRFKQTARFIKYDDHIVRDLLHAAKIILLITVSVTGLAIIAIQTL